MITSSYPCSSTPSFPISSGLFLAFVSFFLFSLSLSLQPIASLLQERDRLEGEDVSERPSLRDRRALLNRTGGGVDRKTIETATDLDPISRALLLQFHDSKIKVNNPILWMRQIHEEKKRSRKHVERFSPLFEMFLLHARVNLQKSPPPDDVPSYDEWRQQEGSARKRTSGRTAKDMGGSFYPSATLRKPVRRRREEEKKEKERLLSTYASLHGKTCLP